MPAPDDAAAPWTPGPWEAAPMGAYSDYDSKSRVILGNDIRIAVVHAGGRDRRVADENDANARLIAAAPSLYEALADILIGYETQSRRLGVGEDAIAAGMQAARAALALARGESK